MSWFKVFQYDEIDLSCCRNIYMKGLTESGIKNAKCLYFNFEQGIVYKVWGKEYNKDKGTVPQLMNGLNSGFYDSELLPHFRGIIVQNGICRGYIMDLVVRLRNMSARRTIRNPVVKDLVKRGLKYNLYYSDISHNNMVCLRESLCEKIIKNSKAKVKKWKEKSKAERLSRRQHKGKDTEAISNRIKEYTEYLYYSRQHLCETLNIA